MGGVAVELRSAAPAAVAKAMRAASAPTCAKGRERAERVKKPMSFNDGESHEY